jgi:hypothetical protein
MTETWLQCIGDYTTETAGLQGTVTRIKPLPHSGRELVYVLWENGRLFPALNIHLARVGGVAAVHPEVGGHPHH